MKKHASAPENRLKNRSDTMVAKKKMTQLSQIIPKEYNPSAMTKLMTKSHKSMSEKERKRVKELE